MRPKQLGGCAAAQTSRCHDGRPKGHQIGSAYAEQQPEACAWCDHRVSGPDRDDPAGVGCIQWRHDRIRVDGDPPGHASVDWVLHVACVAWRAPLAWRGTVAVVGLCIAGLGVVWILTLGPVVALACSMVAFSVIWVSDWPPRRPRGSETFVKVEELKTQHRE